MLAHETLQAAAYLDLCIIKGLNAPSASTTAKQLLDRIAAMLARMEKPATK
jgi:hypothetical protein